MIGISYHITKSGAFASDFVLSVDSLAFSFVSYFCSLVASAPAFFFFCKYRQPPMPKRRTAAITAIGSAALPEFAVSASVVSADASPYAEVSAFSDSAVSAVSSPSLLHLNKCQQTSHLITF